MIRPGLGLITSTRSARNSASSMSWVTKTMVVLTRVHTSSSSSCMFSRVCASSAPNGSSIRQHRGRLISTRAISTRCCMPPDSSRDSGSQSLQDDQRRAARARARRSLRGNALHLQAEGHVVEHLLPRKQRVLLEHDAAIRMRPGTDAPSSCSGPRLGEMPGQRAEQSRLAAARGPSMQTNSPGASQADRPAAPRSASALAQDGSTPPSVQRWCAPLHRACPRGRSTASRERPTAFGSDAAAHAEQADQQHADDDVGVVLKRVGLPGVVADAVLA